MVATPRKTFVAEEDGEVPGAYYLRNDQPGLGSHVSNCGYMLHRQRQGRGLARALCEHSQKTALELGYKAMQLNFVVSTNKAAILLWNTLGFETVAGCRKASIIRRRVTWMHW